MFQDTRPAALHDLGGPDPWAEFRVTARAEIGVLMRQLRDQATPLVLSTPRGASLVTELWSIDSDKARLSFVAEAAHPQLPALLTADEVVAVGYLDSVKLQFDLADLLLVRSTQSSALQARQPEVLYRFQRRSAYRVRTLDRHAPTATLRHPAIPDMQLALRVVDVSIGGCALFMPADVPALEPGVRIQGASIELDADTRFVATLQIQHISSLHNAGEGLRVGCEWRSLGNESERALQRYINQTQKRRRLLSLD